MFSYEKSLRLGLTVVLCTLIFRLFSAGIVIRAADFIARPYVTAFILYLETGRNVRPFLSNPEESLSFVESPPAVQEAVPAETFPVFSGEEAETLSIYNTSGLTPNLEVLLEQETLFQAAEEPMVLILSTHSTESYRYTGQDYIESAPYRTLDPQYNMISLGAQVAADLEALGIPVIQDDTFHDYPSYNYAYAHARKSIVSYLDENPSIQIILDLHRDAAASGSGQMRTHAQVDGKDCAQLMLVMGTNAGGLDHDRWESNLSLALKLQVQLERLAPGITRPLSLRPQRFNQDLSEGALLVEIGAAGNDHEEALRAARILARALAQIIKGSTS